MRRAPVLFAHRDDDILGRATVLLKIAPWREDDWIEYLLSTHRRQCGNVMARVLACGDRARLEGLPALWAPVLEAFAADDSIRTLNDALRFVVVRNVRRASDMRRIRGLCLACFRQRIQKTIPLEDPAAKLLAFGNRLLQHRAVQDCLAVDEAVERIAKRRTAPRWLNRRLPREVVRVLGAAAALNGGARVKLADVLERGKARAQPMAASILHASGAGWRLPARTPCLEGAYLPNVFWSDVKLPAVCATEADLSGADLRRALLEEADFTGADLTSAQLSGANLRGAYMMGAKLIGADLSQTELSDASIVGANLSGAKLESARLVGAILSQSVLREGRFAWADLSHADLTECNLQGADFSGARFDHARLAGTDLRPATLTGAAFPLADLGGCNLEGQELLAADFAQANLTSALLTGTHWPNAKLSGATLCQAGLAEIAWQGADLRGIDLRGATFHMGSSRSGLVFSPYAGEGSKTGFYTDESGEQDYRPPEEIRKANLRDADLRDARIAGVDFYLVDLRGARLSGADEAWARRCGAILDDRSA